MKRKLCILSLIIGLACFGVGGYTAYQIYLQYSQYDIVAETSINLDRGKAVLENLNPRDQRYLQVAYTVDFTTPSTTQTENGWEPQFDYEYKYQLLDRDGNILEESAGLLSSNSNFTFANSSQASKERGSGNVTVYLEKFGVDQPENLTLMAKINPEDPSYNSKLHNARVHLYDNVASSWTIFKYVLIVLASLGLSGLFTLFGIIPLLIELADEDK